MFYVLINGIPFLNDGVNRTISWQFTVTSTDFIINYFLPILYFVLLLIMQIIKGRPYKIISIIFLSGSFIIFLHDSIHSLNYDFIEYFRIILFLVFLVLIKTSRIKARNLSK
jgi:hypothetical protein